MGLREFWAAKPLLEKVTLVVFITANLANAILTDRYGATSHVHRMTRLFAFASMAAFVLALWHGNRSKRRADQNTL